MNGTWWWRKIFWWWRQLCRPLLFFSEFTINKGFYRCEFWQYSTLSFFSLSHFVINLNIHLLMPWNFLLNWGLRVFVCYTQDGLKYMDILFNFWIWIWKWFIKILIRGRIHVYRKINIFTYLQSNTAIHKCKVIHLGSREKVPWSYVEYWNIMCLNLRHLTWCSKINLKSRKTDQIF